MHTRSKNASSSSRLSVGPPGCVPFTSQETDQMPLLLHLNYYSPPLPAGGGSSLSSTSMHAEEQRSHYFPLLGLHFLSSLSSCRPPVLILPLVTLTSPEHCVRRSAWPAQGSTRPRHASRPPPPATPSLVCCSHQNPKFSSHQTIHSLTFPPSKSDLYNRPHCC